MMGAFNRKDKDGIKQDLEWIFTLFPRLAAFAIIKFFSYSFGFL